MHARNRNSQGNGYRTNSMGIGGVATASRLSPEGSMRGPGSHNYEYSRSFNHGDFGHAQSKLQQLQTPRKADVLLEAGRLAAEYLVSKGILPPTALSGKWQNESLKNQLAEFRGFRAQERDNMQLSSDGRTSALSRLGNAGAEAGSGRRRYSDEYNPIRTKDDTRGRKRIGSLRNHSSEWNKELGQSGSWSDKARASRGIEGDYDASSGHRNEKQAVKENDSEIKSAQPVEVDDRTDQGGDPDLASMVYNSMDGAGAKAGTSSSGKDLLSEGDRLCSENSNQINISSEEADADDIKDESDNSVKEQEGGMKKKEAVHCEEETSSSKNNGDLLSLCRFGNVPTRTRSSLTNRAAKVDASSSSKNEDVAESGLPKLTDIPLKDVPVESSSSTVLSVQHQNPVNPVSDNVESPKEQEKLRAGNPVDQGSSRSAKYSQENLMAKEQERSEGPAGLMTCGSFAAERGEKRAATDGDKYTEDDQDAVKKLRGWVPLTDKPSDACFYPSNSVEKQQVVQEPKASHTDDVILSVDEKMMDISPFPRIGAEPSIEYVEEKQLFPGSFKTCDLNLIEASDVSENHDTDPVLIYPSIVDNGKQPVPVDIDLSMSNRHCLPDKYEKHSFNGKEIEVIDLETESVPEDKAFDSGRREETEFAGLDGFSNNANNTNDMSDVQDGYGLMISELLDNDIPNCSSIPGDMNALHNDMGLHNGEGILGDDDSIYMSLGEIPISFLRVWDQPPPEYGKPF